jgi:lysozyme family protein
MDHFDFALSLVLKHEGGHVNDKRDPGGETNLGISDRRDGRIDGMADINGDSVPDVAIAKLTKADAAKIYRRDYWDACKCDQLPAPVAVFLFDTAVNCGNRAAVRMLQRALGVKDDGVIGPVTIAKCRSMAAISAVNYMAIERLNHYRALPTFKTYGKGWTRRVEDVLQQAEQLGGAA